MKKLLCISFPASPNSGVGYLDAYNHNEYASFIYFKKSKLSLFADFFNILKVGCKNDIIVINYVSLFLLFGPLFRCLLKKVIFIPHEGEPLFPASFKKDIRFPRSLVSSIALSKLCVLLASDTYSLSKLQAKYIKANQNNIIRFGVDPAFISQIPQLKLGYFFPNRKCEKIKGFDEIEALYELIVNPHPKELTSSEMAGYYANSKVVVIPSFIETYSYCMVEAMIANCLVVTTKNVGLAYDMQELLGDSLLNEYGIFVLEDVDCVVNFILENRNKLSAMESKTKDLAFELGLTGQAAQTVLDALIAEDHD